MKSAEDWERFCSVLKEHLPYARGVDVTRETKLEDLGLDSITAVEIVIALENAFGTQFAPEDLTRELFDTSGELWDRMWEQSAPGTEG